MQAEWMANAAQYLAAREDWHLLMAQVHIQDSYNHRFMQKLEPLCTGYTKEGEAEAWALFERLYRITDQMIGRIVGACTDEHTTVIVLSDHGCFPGHTRVCVDGILAKAGLLEIRHDPTTGEATIDHGASRLSIEAEGVRDEVVSTLTSVRDPRTGLCPFALVLGQDDLPSLGPNARSPHAVPYFFKAGYTARPLPKTSKEIEQMLASDAFFAPAGHGLHQGLPTIRFKEFSNRAMFIISGSGIVQGKELDRPISLKDVTPTICHLRDIAPPKHCEGGVVWEALAS